MEKNRPGLGAKEPDMERINNLAIIPARSGSKGLVDKNIRKLDGKHLMGYSIEAAINSGIFDCVHVSTDDAGYAEVAKSYGADISFRRPKNLSSDTSDTWDAVRYIVNCFRESGRNFDMITLLQPTSPLRSAQDIKDAYMLFKDKDAESVVSVCEAEHSPRFTKILGKDLSMEGFVDFSNDVRRQTQGKYYHLNGAIYMLSIHVLDDIQRLYGKRSYAYVMPRERSVDIDILQDFEYAEFLLGHGERK